MSEKKRGIILLMFDLPAVTNEDKREYTHFRKDLKRQGFLQLQESCYLKLIRNMSTVEDHILNLKTIMPPNGNVSLLPLSLNDFKGMRCLLGESFNLGLFTADVCFIGDAEDEGA